MVRTQHSCLRFYEFVSIHNTVRTYDRHCLSRRTEPYRHRLQLGIHCLSLNTLYRTDTAHPADPSTLTYITQYELSFYESLSLF